MMTENKMPTRTFAFVSLGCPKNLVDSERMLGKLAQAGYTLTPDADGADVVVVNTCGFIEPAREESLGVIREMLDLKRQGRVGAVVVAGCLAERKKDDLLTEVPEVDHIVGVFGREEITQVLDRTLRHRRRDEQRSLFRPAPVRAFEDTARLRITPRHYAYPIHFTDELIDTLAQSKKVVPYLDMPLQHINDRMLRRMQRRVDRRGTEDLLRRLRAAVPELALRTTFIVGFPGETDAEFEEL